MEPFMKIKTIGLLIASLSLLFIGFGTIGIAKVFSIMAVLFLIMAIVFTINNEYYDAFTKFVNPRMYSLIEGKSDEFVRRNRKWSIIGFYALAALSFINGLITSRNTALKFSITPLLGFGILAWIVIGILISQYLLKKAQTAAQYWQWSIIAGFIFAIAYFIGALVYVVSFAR
jgi:hypothetical protein